MVRDFDAIWARIKRHEGETFTQIRGGEFRYAIEGSGIRPDRTNQVISKKHLKEASGLLPLGDTLPVQHLRGPSYIYALLMDARIRRSEW